MWIQSGRALLPDSIPARRCSSACRELATRTLVSKLMLSLVPGPLRSSRTTPATGESVEDRASRSGRRVAGGAEEGLQRSVYLARTLAAPALDGAQDEVGVSLQDAGLARLGGLERAHGHAAHGPARALIPHRDEGLDDALVPFVVAGHRGSVYCDALATEDRSQDRDKE